jgi:hypothetical protein
MFMSSGAAKLEFVNGREGKLPKTAASSAKKKPPRSS